MPIYVRKRKIVTIEDAFDQDDWSAWSNFSPKVKATVQTVGDDLDGDDCSSKISEATTSAGQRITPQGEPDLVFV